MENKDNFENKHGMSIIPAASSSEGQISAVWETKEMLQVVRNTCANGSTDAEFAVFCYHAKKSGLDPLARQIYSIQRDKKQTIMVGIDGLRLIAHRTGLYQGQTAPEFCGADGVWHDVWLDEKTPPKACRIGVWCHGFRVPTYGVALFREYAQTKLEGGLTYIWRTKPAIMIAKCAEALALRKAFPANLSGLYTAEEFQEADTTPDMAQEPQGIKLVKHEEVKPEATATKEPEKTAEAAEAAEEIKQLKQKIEENSIRLAEYGDARKPEVEKYEAWVLASGDLLKLKRWNDFLIEQIEAKKSALKDQKVK